MYNYLKNNNTNNIKGDDIIRTLEKMLSFAGGIGVGLLYKKYEKNIADFMKKTSRKMDD